MAMDPKVRHSLAAGDWVGTMAHGSYHLPFIGNGRNAWDAWQMGKPWSAAGHAGLFGVEALGMRSAGKVRGTVRGGGVAKGAAKAQKVGDTAKTPHQVLPNSDAFLKSAESVWKDGAQGTLSVAGRALSKHSGRTGSAFSNIKFSGKTANQDSMRVIKEIMNSKNRVIRVNPNGTTDIYDSVSRRGLNISRKGLFNGFRNMD